MSEQVRYYALPEATMNEVIKFMANDQSVALYEKVKKAVLVVGTLDDTPKVTDTPKTTGTEAAV